MTARKTAARRVTAALAAAAVAFSGAVLLAPSASAADYSTGAQTVTGQSVTVTTTTEIADDGTLVLTLADTFDGGDATFRSVGTVDYPIDFDVILPAAFVGSVTVGSNNGAAAPATLLTVTEPSVTETAISALSVVNPSLTVSASKSSVSVSNFSFVATSAALTSAQTFQFTLSGGSTWSSKPTVTIGTDKVAASKVSYTSGSAVVTVTVPSTYSGSRTVTVSGVTVKTSSAASGAASLNVTSSAGTSAGLSTQYFVVAGGTLSLSTTSIARSSAASVSYQSLGAVSGTIRISGIRLAAFVSGDVTVTAEKDGETIVESATDLTVTYSGEARIAGTDRYATSAVLAVEYWGTSGAGQDNVILVDGEDARGGADALSASFLAGAANAPVVLVSQDTISSSVLVALRAQVSSNDEFDTIYVLGDENAISENLASALYSTHGLVDYSSDIVRISGADRFSTSAAVAEEAFDLGVDLATFAVDDDSDALATAFLANGWNTVDALVAASLGYQGYPVFLTNGTGLHSDIASLVEDYDIAQVVVLGAEASVSEDVVDALEDLETSDDDDVVTERVAGATRFDTAAALNEIAIDDDLTENYLTGKIALLFDGFGFADALSASAYAGINGAVLVPTWSDELAGASNTFLSDNATTVNTVTALGGTDRVDSTVLTAATSAAK